MNREIVFYFFAKDNENYFKKFNFIKEVMNKYNFNDKKIVFDLYNQNLLKFKSKLNKLLLNSNETDICILSVDDLPKDSTDFLDIKNICLENNNRIFNFIKREFVI